MHVKTVDVNTAFYQLVGGIFQKRIPTRTEDSRNGPVIQIDEPVLLTYERPLQRVLFNKARDCNPFAHLFESLWMLAGRRDIAPICYYMPNYKNYSDDGETSNGAYGWRWRCAPIAVQETQVRNYDATGKLENQPLYTVNRVDTIIQGSVLVDQLNIIVDHLTRMPNSRRAVLQMWNVEDDLMKIGSDLASMQGKVSKDVCCNLSVMFALREIVNGADDRYDRDRGARKPYYVLDMTVTNRSNDLVWGMLGANYVHFSFLQEYMAARLGVEVGLFHTFTNNLHIYTQNNSGFKPEEWLAEDANEIGYQNVSKINRGFVPLVRDHVMFDKEVNEFVNHHSKAPTDYRTWVEPFFNLVAQPMMEAFHYHKDRQYKLALKSVDNIQPFDWRLVARTWIEKRKANYEAKLAQETVGQEGDKI